MMFRWSLVVLTGYYTAEFGVDTGTKSGKDATDDLEAKINIQQNG